ncbi:MAG: tyrosine-type recombinase/integrase [Halobacteriales archaeon]|nr:tyrosine-type recombinase/integrase [Halobacteriales archaeon]
MIRCIGEPRNKLAAIIMAKTGARITEVLTLEMDDLMLEDGFVRFRNRKGGKNTVNPIDDETIRSIQRYTFIRDDSTDKDYLFLSIRGDRVGREQIRRAVRQGAVDAGIMKEGEKRFHKKFTPHTYRTVFTTLMRNQGMDDHLVRYLRGDADREEMDLYTRIDKDQLRRKYLEKIKTLNL